MPFDQPLAAIEMRRVLETMMDGRMSPQEIRGFLETLAGRGETAEEIAAAVLALRARAVRLPLSRAYELCDTCGTGGDQQNTINVSTLAALVAAAAGVRVAKHGNRAASSRCGSADLLEALGVNLDASPEQVARCIEELGFGFCFAPRFHPSMKAVAPIRKALGIRTLFNLIGPLANPAPLTFQLVGVSEARLLQPMAEALQRLGVRHGLAVHGRDGMDEVSTTGTTDYVEVQGSRLSRGALEPGQFGVRAATLEQLRGGDAAHNASQAVELLGGARASPLQDIIAVNAGCVLYVADRAKTVEAGIEGAREVLRSGAALRLLQRVVEFTSHAG